MPKKDAFWLAILDILILLSPLYGYAIFLLTNVPVGILSGGILFIVCFVGILVISIPGK